MADMRVKLFLDLVNRLSPGAKSAARDIKGVKDAAKSLKSERPGDQIAAGLKKVQPAARGATRELKGVKGAAREIRSERGPEKLASDLNRARAAAARLKGELRAAKAAQRDFQRSSPLADMNAGKGKGVGAAAGGAVLAAGRSALMPLAAAYGGYRAVGAGVRGTVGQSVSFEKSMADVIKKVDLPEGKTPADLEKMITSSAIRFGRSREEIAGLTAELGAAGVAYQDLGRSIELATKASVSWDIIPSETGEKLAKIRTQHSMTLDQLEEFGDKVNALADSGASKERDIVEMFQRAAAGAKAADVDQDTSLAFMTAMNAGGMQSEVAARGFGTMISKLRTAKSLGNKKMADGLKTLGLTPGGVEKGIRTDALKTMLNLMDRFAASNDKAAVAVKMFGQEWWDEFARMVQGAPEIAKNLKLLNDPKQWKGSMDTSLNIELKTTDNHLKRLASLASTVGDRLGRWALPPINDAIERVIAGMDALDKRASEQKANDAIVEKVGEGKPLSPAEREQMANDRALASRVGREGDRQADNISRNSEIREKGVTDSERQKLEWRRDRLKAEEAALQGQIDAVNRRSRNAPAAAQATVELERKQIEARRKREEIDRALQRGLVASADPRRPADQDERAGQKVDSVDRAAVMALKERISQLESRLRTLDELRDLSPNPADKAGFRDDQKPYFQRRAAAEVAFRNAMAPNLIASRQFSLNGGSTLQGAGWKGGKAGAGAPTKAVPPTGSGRLSFGLDGASSTASAQWASKIRSDMDIDLGPAGMTMVEKLEAGIAAGAAGAQSAADGVKSGITGAFAGADLSGAGAAMMATLETGITAGGARAVAAAQRVAQQVKAAAASGAAGGSGRQAISGALHDGVE